MKHSTQAQPFRLNGLLANVPFGRPLEAALEKALGLRRLRHLYGQLPATTDDRGFLAQTFSLLQIDAHLDPQELEHVPREGAALVVANHPYGAVEGMVLAAQLRQRRADVKIMANYLLKRVPELSDLFISVDPFGGNGARQANMRPLRDAIQWLRGGGLLVVFPAGEVSHFHPSRGRVTDPRWSDVVARLLRRCEAPVVPVYFAGRNSLLFQAAGLLHPALRTAMLPRELLNKQGRTLQLRIGKPIAHSKLRGYKDDRELTAYLRLRTYSLAELQHSAPSVSLRPSVEAGPEPLADAPPAPLLAAEVAALPAANRLAQSGDLEVYFARAEQMPWLLQEIGRLRELTFRLTGEGTGKASDIDLFDSYYLHLFVWNRNEQQVVGAYRLGLADEIANRYGKKGLYTHSLFKYKRRLLDALNPAIELGRSFVRPEYQRSFSPLLLLWKGIGQFVAANPRYRVLFGPVSISNEYDSVSRQLLVEFLRASSYQPQLARHVKPRRPFRGSRRRVWCAEDLAAIGDVDSLSDVVAQFETDAKGVPILLKQYLKLGGRLLGFNVDEDFSDALDGLIMVDLRDTDERVLQRYMGKEQARGFLAYHAPQAQTRKAG